MSTVCAVLEKKPTLEEPNCRVLPATPLVLHGMSHAHHESWLRMCQLFQMWAEQGLRRNFSPTTEQTINFCSGVESLSGLTPEYFGAQQLNPEMF